MTPANDLWANATAISANEWLDGSNAGATSELGEPANNGATVWWVFKPSASGNYVVSTKTNDAVLISQLFGINPPVSLPPGFSVNNCTNFNSKVQVFTGFAVNALTEVNYTTVYSTPPGPNKIAGDFSAHAYLGIPYEFGDLVAFAATAGTTYYIRVDSRSAVPVSSGNIILSVYSCIPCSGQCAVSPGIHGFNIVTFGNRVINGNTIPGNYPAGTYTVKYCSGALINITSTANPPTPWTTMNWPTVYPEPSGTPTDAFGNYNGIFVIYDNGNSFAAFGSPSGYYQTQEDAVEAAAGSSVTFQHTGGTIGIEFINDFYGDNKDGNPNPTFYLIDSNGGCTSGCQFAPTIENAVFNCSGTDTLDVTLAQPGGVNAGIYTLKLSNIVGFTAANNSIQISATGATFGATFYITTPPFNTTVSATITVEDQSGNVCSTYNFSTSVSGGFEANGAALNSSQIGYFSGTFNLMLSSSFGCDQINGCSVSLAAGGGISNPSAPVGGVNFTAGKSVPVNFSFQAGQETLTATLNVFSAAGIQIAQVEFELSANLVATGQNTGGAFSCDPPYNEFFGCPFSLTLKNNGMLASYNVQAIVQNECTSQSETIQFGIINPGQSVTVNPGFGIAQGVSRPVTVVFQLQQTGPGGLVTTFPNYNYGSEC